MRLMGSVARLLDFSTVPHLAGVQGQHPATTAASRLATGPHLDFPQQPVHHWIRLPQGPQVRRLQRRLAVWARAPPAAVQPSSDAGRAEEVVAGRRRGAAVGHDAAANRADELGRGEGQGGSLVLARRCRGGGLGNIIQIKPAAAARGVCDTPR
jgi:hypothetical protein